MTGGDKKILRPGSVAADTGWAASRAEGGPRVQRRGSDAGGPGAPAPVAGASSDPPGRSAWPPEAWEAPGPPGDRSYSY